MRQSGKTIIIQRSKRLMWTTLMRKVSQRRQDLSWPFKVKEKENKDVKSIRETEAMRGVWTEQSKSLYGFVVGNT